MTLRDLLWPKTPDPPHTCQAPYRAVWQQGDRWTCPICGSEWKKYNP